MTYLPFKSGFILTSNRDEILSRAATTFPSYLENGPMKICFPRDPLSNGSWIALTRERTTCLLNGAFEKHDRNASYRKSRGTVLLESFVYDDLRAFADEYEFDDIEPFTMVAIESRASTVGVSQLIWDGEKAHVEVLPPGTKRIWSSVTLYDQGVRQRRQLYFESVNLSDERAILNFHQTKSEELGSENSFFMSRTNGPCTISTTQVKHIDDRISMEYIDYITEQSKMEKL